MTVRRFDKAFNQYISCMATVSVGDLSGPHTFIAVAKPIGAHPGSGDCFLSVSVATSTLVGNLQTDAVAGKLGYWNGIDYVTAAVGVTSDEWQIFAVTKAAGTVVPRFHRAKLGTGVMTHVNGSDVLAPIANVPSELQIGSVMNAAFGSAKNMECALVAVIKSVLTDGNLETILATASTASIDAFSPAAGYELNQIAPSVILTDWTGSGDHEFWKVGTSVVTGDDPPGWAFGPAAPPAVTPTAPAITGIPETFEVLTCTQGLWTGSPTPVLTAQWKRNTGSGYVNIAGATSLTYTLQVADEGAFIKCVITGTNSLGSSTADSNIITPVPPPPLEVQLHLSGGATNSNPINSFGGVVSSVEAGINLFDDVPRSEANPGFVEYRCVYVFNDDTTPGTAAAWISAQPATAVTFSLGVATQAAGVTVPAPANSSTAPAGVTFSAPSTLGTALALGTLNPGQGRGLWIRRTVPANCAPAHENDLEISLRVTPL